MANQTTRIVGGMGQTRYITLPGQWVETNKVEKGDKVILEYNGVLKVIPIFEVKIERDAVWFTWKDKKVGLKLTEVQRVIKLHGFDEALQLIKTALVKRNGFPDGFPIEMMKEKLLPYVVEFLK